MAYTPLYDMIFEVCYYLRSTVTMKFILAALFVSGAVPTVPKVCGQSSTFNIYRHSLPWQAFLKFGNYPLTWYCSGALISDTDVITSAHCAKGASTVDVTLGGYNILEPESTQLVQTSVVITVHKDYDDGFANDIALIYLKYRVDFTPAIQLIPLPSSDDVDNDHVGELATTGGWGYPRGDFKMFEMSVASKSASLDVYGNTDGYVLFAKNANSSSTECAGDAGAPLVTNGTLIGITTFVGHECRNGTLSGFTKVSNYLRWITNNSVTVKTI